MIRVTEAEQASRVRISQTEGRIYRALASLLDEIPDLTYVELSLALLNVAGRQLEHQRRAETDQEEPS